MSPSPPEKSTKTALTAGFTLIELSIVLVVIGLIVGGVLVGKDLINAAAVRAQITQVEQFNTAAHTFQLKYDNYLPGDIPDPTASSLGFKARGTYPGEGDGNGIIQGSACASSCAEDFYQSTGETAMFWVDLSPAGDSGEAERLLHSGMIPNTIGA